VSTLARRNLERIIARVDPARIDCRIVDLRQHPLAGEADRIAFTPTLVKKHPGPRTWILGNLRNSEIVTDLLRASGIDLSE
jgi:hypothetical protein